MSMWIVWVDNLRKEQEYSIIDYVDSCRYPVQADIPST